MLGLATAAITSCSDQSEEITSYQLGRNLSPINVEANSVGETEATIRWEASAHATSYNLEIFADDSLTFAGSPAKTITGVTNTSAKISGLLFDTQYSVRVQAITDNDASRTSTWQGVYFKTSSKQFLKSPKPAEIADRSVILTWEVEEGFDVTTAVVGSITHTITAEEKAAGQCTVEGLSPETTYTAYLYYNGKQCGNRNFTTIADLNGAILIHPGDDLKAAIEEAENGATIALYGGTYYMNQNEEGAAGAVKVSSSISIKGIYPTDQPILKGRFELHNGAGLNVSQVVIDGSENASGDQTFNYKEAGLNYGALNVQDVTIMNFVKGICYGNVTATIESITLNNCIVGNVECDGGDFFDIRKSYAKTVTFSKSTFYNIAQKRDFIRYDDASGDYTDAAPVITVDQCTIDNCLNETDSKRLLYVRFVGNSIKWTNNLVTNTKAVYTNQSKTSTPEYSNNYYFGCSNANLFAASNPDADPKTYWSGDVNGKNGEDPKYADAANGNFTIGNSNVSKLKVGDPRWY